jgi:hypothetical protein
MSHENDCQWQCSFCSACFPTNNSLQQHFEEYRVSLTPRELDHPANSVQLRAAELERCKSHADANKEEQASDSSGSSEDGSDIIRANTRCPKCPRRKPFATGQQLRVHFRTRRCPRPDLTPSRCNFSNSNERRHHMRRGLCMLLQSLPNYQRVHEAYATTRRRERD